MTVQIHLELPEEIFSVLRNTPENFVKEMRLAAAVKWYEMGKISQSKAAQVANLSRQDFLLSLKNYGISPFQISPEELENELKNE